MIKEEKLDEARELYITNLKLMKSERETAEVHLAAAWLEEKYFGNGKEAIKLIQMALSKSPSNSRLQVALARLESRMHRRKDRPGKEAARKRLSDLCIQIEKDKVTKPDNGRLFNAWANLEVKAGRLEAARTILQRGRELFPNDSNVSTDVFCPSFVSFGGMTIRHDATLWLSPMRIAIKIGLPNLVVGLAAHIVYSFFSSPPLLLPPSLMIDVYGRR